jgi:hypothetical protein
MMSNCLNEDFLIHLGHAQMNEIRAKRQLLELWPPVDFFASMTWLNCSVPKFAITKAESSVICNNHWK